MSTSNFRSQNIDGIELPLIACILENDKTEARYKEFMEEQSLELDEDMYPLDIYIEGEYRGMVDYACDCIEEYPHELEFFQIETRGGYYEGFQLYVNELEWYPDDDDKRENELHCLPAILRRIGEEAGMVKLNVIARFSNGETIYEREVA